MRTTIHRPLLALAALLTLSATAASAADGAPATAPKPYPLTTCIVSGDPLDSMGKPLVVVREGQEIKLCCKGCIKELDQDPAGFIKKIDEAAKAKGTAAPAAPAAPATPAPAHQH